VGGGELAASPPELDLGLQDLSKLWHRSAERRVRLDAARMRKGPYGELRVEQLQQPEKREIGPQWECSPGARP
jgi:hypothetical protein